MEEFGRCFADIFLNFDHWRRGSHTTLMGTHIDSAKWRRGEKRVVAFGLLSVWMGFLLGVVTLVIFAVKNLF